MRRQETVTGRTGRGETGRAKITMKRLTSKQNMFKNLPGTVGQTTPMTLMLLICSTLGRVTREKTFLHTEIKALHQNTQEFSLLFTIQTSCTHWTTPWRLLCTRRSKLHQVPG